jgi:hypothetical protein
LSTFSTKCAALQEKEEAFENRERELRDFRTEPPKGEEKRGKKKIGEEIFQRSKRDSSSRL